MKARYIYDINDTLVFINEYIQDKMFSYDAVKEHIDAYNGRDWTLEITNIDDDDEFFDFACGNMGFTLYKNDDGSARLCSNATYYTYDDDGDMADTYDIEL